jgi:hypothetical protein
MMCPRIRGKSMAYFGLANASSVPQGWAKGQNPRALHKCSAHCSSLRGYRNGVLIRLLYNDDNNDDNGMS